MNTYKHEYLISSERAWRRSDEERNKFFCNELYKAGDIIELDGIIWTVDEVIR